MKIQCLRQTNEQINKQTFTFLEPKKELEPAAYFLALTGAQKRLIFVSSFVCLFVFLFMIHLFFHSFDQVFICTLQRVLREQSESKRAIKLCHTVGA